MEHRDWKNSLQETAGRHASRRGAFSAGLTALAVAAADKHYQSDLEINIILQSAYPDSQIGSQCCYRQG